MTLPTPWPVLVAQRSEAMTMKKSVLGTQFFLDAEAASDTEP